MVQKNGITLRAELPIVAGASPDQVREMIPVLIGLMQQALSTRFAADFSVEASELSDIVKKLAEIGKIEERNVELFQTINVWRGWREGASVKLYWSEKTPAHIELRSYASCCLEDWLGNCLMVWPGTILAAMQIFSGRMKIIRMLLWGFVGFGAGALVYCVAGLPILKILTRRFAASSAEIATQAFSQSLQTLKEHFQERHFPPMKELNDPAHIADSHEPAV